MDLDDDYEDYRYRLLNNDDPWEGDIIVLTEAQYNIKHQLDLHRAKSHPKRRGGQSSGRGGYTIMIFEQKRGNSGKLRPSWRHGSLTGLF